MLRTTIFLLLVLTNINIYSQKSEFRQIINKYADTISEQKYGIIALLKHDGKTYKEAIGWASDSAKMTPDKVFNIGSTTKMFTAVLIMQEIEKGTLNLNYTIGKFFPPNKNVDPKITVEQLLRHRSGLGELAVDTLINRAASNYFFKYNSAMLYKKIPPPQFPKDTKFKYTNTNYILLGYILELINNKPYSILLKNRIFEPSNMNNSYAYYSNTIENAAHPMFHGKDLGKVLNFKYYENFCFSAGGISSTVKDLKRFFTKLYETNLLISRNSFKKMTDFQDYYGMGIELIPVNSNIGKYHLIGHGGDNISFKLRNYYNPKTKDLIILASNHFGKPFIGKITDELIELLEKNK